MVSVLQPRRPILGRSRALHTAQTSQNGTRMCVEINGPKLFPYNFEIPRAVFFPEIPPVSTDIPISAIVIVCGRSATPSEFSDVRPKERTSQGPSNGL